MSDKDSILLSLRFFDINDPIANAPVPSRNAEEDLRNTYFKVKRQSKFGSLVKKFAQLNNTNPYDLTFYHLTRFLNPASTIAELRLKNEDQILVKKLIPVSVHFTNDEAVNKSQFQIVKDSVVIKIEEDCAFYEMYNILLTHLQVVDSRVPRSTHWFSSVEFYVILYEESIQKAFRIHNITDKLNKMGISANSNIVVRLNSEDQLKLFQEKIAIFNKDDATSNKLLTYEATISDLRKQVQSLEKKNSQMVIDHGESSRAKVRELEEDKSTLLQQFKSTKTTLSDKLTLINSLQTEKKKLADDLSYLNERVKNAEEKSLTKDKEIVNLKATISELQQKFEHLQKQVSEINNQMNNRTLQFKKQLNDEALSKLRLEQKLKFVEQQYKNYALRMYNKAGFLFYNFQYQYSSLIEMVQNLIKLGCKNEKIASEINLDPIDFDYLNIIIDSTTVPDKFAKVDFDFDAEPNTKSNTNIVTRPQPMLKYVPSDNILYNILITLYQHDKEIKGLTIQEIAKFSNLTTSDVSNKLIAYLNGLQRYDQNLVYNVNKTWNAEKNSAVYAYDKLVNWIVPSSNGEDIVKIPKFQELKEEQLPEVSQLSKVDVVKALQIEEKFKAHSGNVQVIKDRVNRVLVNSLNNVSKNLLNVLRLIKGFKDNEAQFAIEKQEMIRQFKLELQNAADKVSFVSSYDAKLNALSEEIERMRQEKLLFEKDNDIFARFKNFSVPSPAPLKAIQAASNSNSNASPPPIVTPLKFDNRQLVDTSTTIKNGSFDDITKENTNQDEEQKISSKKRHISIGDTFDQSQLDTNNNTTVDNNNNNNNKSRTREDQNNQIKYASASDAESRSTAANGTLHNGSLKAAGGGEQQSVNMFNNKSTNNVDQLRETIHSATPVRANDTNGNKTLHVDLINDEPAPKRQKIESVGVNGGAIESSGDKDDVKADQGGGSTLANVTTGTAAAEMSTQPLSQSQSQSQIQSQSQGPGQGPAKEDEVYLNIKIELTDTAPVFFKIKKTTKLKRILKSYKTKLLNNASTKLSKQDVEAVKFTLGGTLVKDYNQQLQALNLKDYSIITAAISRT